MRFAALIAPLTWLDAADGGGAGTAFPLGGDGGLFAVFAVVVLGP